MSHLTVHCPACAKKYEKVEAELVGRRFKCVCGHIFRFGKKSDRSSKKRKRKKSGSTTSSKKINSSGGLPTDSRPSRDRVIDGIVVIDSNSTQTKRAENEIITAELAQPELASDSFDFSKPMAAVSVTSPSDRVADVPQKMTLANWLLLALVIFVILLTTGVCGVIFIAGDKLDPSTYQDSFPQMPFALGGFMLLSGTIVLIRGLIGIATGAMRIRFGIKVTGIEARIHGFAYFSLGLIFAVSGTVFTLKHL